MRLLRRMEHRIQKKSVQTRRRFQIDNIRVLTLSMCVVSDVNNGKQQNPAGPALQCEQTAGHFPLSL